MKYKIIIIVFLIGLVGWLTAVFHPLFTHAAPTTDAVVGNGNPASCHQGTFDVALDNVQNSGGGTITFNCGGAVTIILTNQKFINADVTIDGDNLISLSGNNSTNLFAVNNALTLNNLALTNGFVLAGYGGAIVVNNGGRLLMNNSSISDSSTGAGFAGGAIIDFGGRVTLNDSLILNNSTAWGAINSTGWLTLTNTIVQGNTAVGGGGGGLSVGGHVFIQNSQIISNSTDMNGGGLYVTPSADVTILNSLVSGNTAVNMGGGMYSEGAATLSGATFDQNSANDGGGLAVVGTTITITGSIFTGNVAVRDGGGIDSETTTATLTDVILDNNQAEIGGGISIYDIISQTTLKDVTISNNRGSFAGGGLDNDGTLVGDGVTFMGNSGRYGGGLRNDEGKGYSDLMNFGKIPQNRGKKT